MSKPATTPLMRQHAAIKAKHPDAVLLFRVGDFYETFGTDAVTASRVLGITLTSRNNGGSREELAGFPYHQLDNYLHKLVRAGLRVAVCDQLEDPKQAKTIVQRGVTQVATPGVSFSDQLIDRRDNHWLAALCGGEGGYGAAFLDVTTGEFLVAQEGAEAMAKLIDGHAPRELLFPKGRADAFIEAAAGRTYGYALDDWAFADEFARERLLGHFGTASLKGFGIEELRLAQRAAGAVLHYLGETRNDRLAHIAAVSRLHPADHVGLDRFTIRNLELVAPSSEGGRSLLQSLDRCETPMGSRLLKRWILFPLVDRARINERLDQVGGLIASPDLAESLGTELRAVGDLERLVGKAAAARIAPRELLQLAQALEASDRARALLANGAGALQEAAHGIAPPLELAAELRAAIEPETPATLAKGGVIRAGVHAELDELRHITTHAKEVLLDVQRREAERTGISSLKVGYNSVFGYYLEVRHTHKDKVPSEWVRKQTLTGAERYITDELKALEERILGAEERILALEQDLYAKLVQRVTGRIGTLQSTAQALARLDVLRAFALNASDLRYCRPEVNDGTGIDIRQGRHPVIEQLLPAGEAYVANDVVLDPDERQITVITGPNMSGKSALLRQTALIALMAQMGSYVPASAARIGVLDRVFTRVGANDSLSTGESTFMVEMNESASILNNLSPRSLVLLDEIGRGTSTYDGISIAWAIAEHLHEHPMRPRTLFATHYHELNAMADSFPRIRNASVAVREVEGRVLFLRRLVPGGSDRSFGIHVAQMAGMPASVVQRAKKVLAHLERAHAGNLGEDAVAAAPKAALHGMATEPQLSIFQLDDPALEAIREQLNELDIDTLTPVEALLKLNEIKRMAGAGKAKLRKA